jgi:hypothetical protein
MHRRRLHAEPPVALPRPPAPAASPAAFVCCPAAWFPAVSVAQLAWQQAVYQWAYEQAQAVTRPSILERDLLGVWN